MYIKKGIVTSLFFLILKLLPAQQTLTTEVLVIGGGTSGVSAGIQAARFGAKTIIVEEGPWLGGMLSAAGVSATDGNHLLPSGIWGEFRQQVYNYYGGAKKVATGWVSNTHFEPHVAASIFSAMAAAEKNLQVLHGYQFLEVIQTGFSVVGARFLNIESRDTLSITSLQVIDASELGDVLSSASIPFDVGMESSALTGENVNILESNDIVQDLTYVTILKDYGVGVDCTITKPAGYDPREFDGACLEFYKDSSRIKPGVSCEKMLSYAKLPGKKYMLNWPAYGNDIYLEVANLSKEQRAIELNKAKQQTLRYVYFIQHELGYRHLGLADDEFTTSDRLAYIPYYREGRRVKGVVRFNLQHISDPFNENHPFYRTGVAVGDYPVDQHHRKNPNAPQHLSFYPIPSFSIPLGALIPANHRGIIIAEKAISVSNVVNGASRLQPCVLLVGQAAGTLAALTVKGKLNVASEVPVRLVQDALLSSGGYLMPYADVLKSHPNFSSIQRIGAVGILKGVGQPSGWANRTWFYPDSTVRMSSFLASIPLDLKVKDDSDVPFSKHDYVTISSLASWIYEFSASSLYVGAVGKKRVSKKSMTKHLKDFWPKWKFENFDIGRPLMRKEIATVLDELLDPFHRLSIDHRGKFIL
jgi:hypothetical protein